MFRLQIIVRDEIRLLEMFALFYLILALGGGPTPFLPMEKCVFSHFSPWGKMGKKGKSIHFPLFPYNFSPWEKMGKYTFFHGQKWGWTPPPFKRI